MITLAKIRSHLSCCDWFCQIVYVSLWIKRNLLTLATQPLKLKAGDACQEHPVTQDWTLRARWHPPSIPSPLPPPSPEISTWLLLHQCSSRCIEIAERCTAVSHIKLYFVLRVDIVGDPERYPSIDVQDQNEKIIEEIITCFTLRITLTRSSIQKAHRGRFPPRSR